MAQEFTPKTAVGNIPQVDEFQRVKNTSVGGKTGEPERGGMDGKVLAVAQTVQGIFANHSEKLFAITALIGFSLIFYAGEIEDWIDFAIYTAFLGVVLVFYGILALAKKIASRSNKKKEES